jgi:hypothetical protein
VIFALDANTLICFLKGLGRVKEKLFALSPADIAGSFGCAV